MVPYPTGRPEKRDSYGSEKAGTGLAGLNHASGSVALSFSKDINGSQYIQMESDVPHGTHMRSEEA